MENQLEWYLLAGFLGAGLFFLLAAWALNWAVKNGQMEELDAGAKSIFDEDEPEGQLTDSFPQKRKKGQRKSR